MKYGMVSSTLRFIDGELVTVNTPRYESRAETSVKHMQAILETCQARGVETPTYPKWLRDDLHLDDKVVSLCEAREDREFKRRKETVARLIAFAKSLPE